MDPSLILPNGRSIVLERQQGTDSGGYSGLEDELNNHWAELLKGCAFVHRPRGWRGDWFRDGYRKQRGHNPGAPPGRQIRFNQTGQQVVRRNLNIQPTLTIRPGFAVRVMVNRDLGLEPCKG